MKLSFAFFSNENLIDGSPVKTSFIGKYFTALGAGPSTRRKSLGAAALDPPLKSWRQALVKRAAHKAALVHLLSTPLAFAAHCEWWNLFNYFSLLKQATVLLPLQHLS